MQLPFSGDQFFDVFRRYNEAVWPMQWVLLALAMAAAASSFWSPRFRSRFPARSVAALWIWCGLVYHIAFFRSVNPLALVFGVAFVAQGVLLLWAFNSGRARVRLWRRNADDREHGSVFCRGLHHCRFRRYHHEHQFQQFQRRNGQRDTIDF